MHVFIDTNIFLKFFHFSKDDLSALEEVFASREQGSAQVHLTAQVREEFHRNRETKISDALKRFKSSTPPANFPSFMRSYPVYYELVKINKKLQKKYQQLCAEVEKDIKDQNLLADRLMLDILERSKVITTSDSIYEAAMRRSNLRNPPGKSGSIGDAINWIQLLDNVPQGADLHLISEDGDFYSLLDEKEPHPFLRSEWKSAKNSSLFVYRTVSEFLKKHFDGVAFAYDSRKEELIDGIAAVGSFAGTHQFIEKLEEFSYFSFSEVDRLLSAACGNSQFGGIVTDYDVSDFLYRVAVPHRDKVTDSDHRALLQEVIEEQRERPED